MRKLKLCRHCKMYYTLYDKCISCARYYKSKTRQIKKIKERNKNYPKSGGQTKMEERHFKYILGKDEEENLQELLKLTRTKLKNDGFLK